MTFSPMDYEFKCVAKLMLSNWRGRIRLPDLLCYCFFHMSKSLRVDQRKGFF